MAQFRGFIMEKNERPQKAAMREIMRSYRKENEISIKNEADAHTAMCDGMSVISEAAPDEEMGF